MFGLNTTFLRSLRLQLLVQLSPEQNRIAIFAYYGLQFILYPVRAFLVAIFITSSLSAFAQEASEEVKVNQLDYLMDGPKWAFVSDSVPLNLNGWEIRSSSGDTAVYPGTGNHSYEFDPATEEYVYRIDFSAFEDTGSFYLQVNGVGRSYPFDISESPYNEAFRKIMKGFYFLRSGVELTEEYAGNWARPAEYANDAYVYLGFEDNQVLFLTGMGHLDPSPRYLMPVSTTATADFAAAMAQASRVFREINPAYADSCLSAAENAWLALENDTIWNNPTRIETLESEVQEVLITNLLTSSLP